MRKKRKIGSTIYMILVYLFLFTPIIAVMIGSVNSNSHNLSFDGFTLEWYADLLENTSLLEGLQNTILVAVTSTGLSVFIGTLAAFGMFRFKFKGKTVLDTMFYIPIVVPEIVLGISLMVIFSMMNITAGLTTLIIAHTTFCIPYVVFNVRASIAVFDPSWKKLPWIWKKPLGTFLHVTLP
jgi:spermidine/putrescine transport system permease protein